MSINWKQKLSSRKLWIGIALVVIGVILCVTGDVANGLKVITIGGVGYLGAECIVDVARAIWPSDGDSETEITDETVYTIDLAEDETEVE